MTRKRSSRFEVKKATPSVTTLGDTNLSDDPARGIKQSIKTNQMVIKGEPPSGVPLLKKLIFGKYP